MEGFDRPLFPEIIPAGMVLSGNLLPLALKPFPTRQEWEEESWNAEEAAEDAE